MHKLLANNSKFDIYMLVWQLIYIQVANNVNIFLVEPKEKNV